MRSAEIKRLEIKFIILITVMLSLFYGIFIFSINVFQEYTFAHHINPKIYNFDTIQVTIITISLIVLNLFTRFQSLKYQRILLSILVLVILILHVSLKNYPLLAGLSGVATELGKVWFQLYVPPSVRATFAGVLTSIAGIIRIRSTTMETHWLEVIFRKEVACCILTVGLFFFWRYTLKLEKLTENKISFVSSENLFHFVLQNPYIFFAGFIAGFNSGMFYYTFLMGDAILSADSAQIYQYVVYSGSILCPILIGILADKFNLALINFVIVICVMICKFIDAGLMFFHVSNLSFYVVGFVEAGFVASLWTLSASMVGEQLRTKGIFRAFAISSICLTLGSMVYGYLYLNFSSSFMETKLTIGIVSLVFVLLLWLFYKRLRA